MSFFAKRATIRLTSRPNVVVTGISFGGSAPDRRPGDILERMEKATRRPHWTRCERTLAHHRRWPSLALRASPPVRESASGEFDSLLYSSFRLRA